MKGKITIEVDFNDNNQPYIHCLVNTQSDDVRDKLLNHFRQLFGFKSNWARVEFSDEPSVNSETTILRIYPIGDSDLQKQVKYIGERL